MCVRRGCAQRSKAVSKLPKAPSADAKVFSLIYQWNRNTLLCQRNKLTLQVRSVYRSGGTSLPVPSRNSVYTELYNCNAQRHAKSASCARPCAQQCSSLPGPMVRANASAYEECPPMATFGSTPACAASWPASQATPPGDRRPGVYLVNLFKGQRHRDQHRWLEYYLLLGATHFVMVDNNCNRKLAEQATRTLLPYVERGLVTHVTNFRCASMPDVTLDNLLKRGCARDPSAPPFASCELCRSDVLGSDEMNGLPINSYERKRMSPKSAALSCSLSQVTGLRFAHRNSLVLLVDDDEYVVLRSPQFRLPDLAEMLVARRKCAMPILWRQHGSSGYVCQPDNQIKHFLKRAPAASEVTSEEERTRLDRQKRLATKMKLNQPIKGKTVFLASTLGCTTHVCTACVSGMSCGYTDSSVCPTADYAFDRASNMSFDRDVWIAHYSYQSEQHFAAKIERGRTNDRGTRKMPTLAVARYYNTVHDARPWSILNARIHAQQNEELRTCLIKLFDADPKPSTSWMEKTAPPELPDFLPQDFSGSATERPAAATSTGQPAATATGQAHRPDACTLIGSQLSSAAGGIRTVPDPLIIAAGEGTTATRSLAEALGELGIWSAHNGRLFSPPGTKKAVHSKVQLELQELIQPLYTKKPEENADYDFAGLAGHRWGAIMDTPVPIYLPWLLKAFPQAKVILTVRDPMAWAKSRLDNHEFSPAPLHGLYHGVGYEPKKFATVTVRQHETEASIRAGSAGAPATAGKIQQVATAFAMYNTYVACAVRPPQSFLLLNIFESCSEQLWSQISTFLEIKVDVSTLPPFPGGSPSCKSPKFAPKAAPAASVIAHQSVKSAPVMPMPAPSQKNKRYQQAATTDFVLAPGATQAEEWLSFGRSVLFVHLSGAGGTSMVAWARAAGLRVPTATEGINANEACGDDSVPNAHHYSWAGVVANTSRCSCEGEEGMRFAGFNFWATESIVRAPLACPKMDYWIILRRPVSRIMSRLTKLEAMGKGVPLPRVTESLRGTVRFAPHDYGRSEFSGTPSFNNWLVRSLVGPAAYNLPLGAVGGWHLQKAMEALDGFSIVLPVGNLSALPRLVSARYGRCIKVPVPSLGGFTSLHGKPKGSMSRRRDDNQRRAGGTADGDGNYTLQDELRESREKARKRARSELRLRAKQQSAAVTKAAEGVGAPRRLAERVRPQSKGLSKLNKTELVELAGLLVKHNAMDEQLYAYGLSLFQMLLASAKDPCQPS